MMTPEEFRARRHHLKMTQDDLAWALGRSRRQIIRYENGTQRVPRIVELLIRRAKPRGKYSRKRS